MRSVPAGLAAQLAEGATTLCRCWLVTRRDGVVLGFTDHDRDVSVGAVSCRAATGLSASEATARLGLAVDGTEIAGALSDDALGEADLAAGRFDAAAIAVWLVDWSDSVNALLLAIGVLGEVRRDGAAFSAELRSLSHRLGEESGRLYTARCGADVGDARCGVDLDDAAFRAAATVTAIEGRSRLRMSGLEAFDDGFFTAGRLAFTSGANAGLAVEVKEHRAEPGGALVRLWQAMPEPIGAGDSVVVTAGCDKSFPTCRVKFNNVRNFRGFPHIPGNDFVITYPVSGQPGNDGKSLVG